MKFTNPLKKASRLQEIAQILGKYGFKDLVVNIVPDKRALNWIKPRKENQFSRAELLRMATEELGPTFIKGAQVLSNRPDLIPADLIHEFQKLQSSVPPFPTETVVEIVESELGKAIDIVFEWFDEDPLGAASIGQVHAAQLRNGDEVVVKIQRPKVQELVALDFAVIYDIVKLAEKYFESLLGGINARDIVIAFEKNMNKELDYTCESRNIDQFRKYYKDYTNFYVPKVYKDYSTNKVMVLEKINGCKITDLEQLKKWKIDPEKIAEEGMHIYMTQIFEHGYFHADPHPGNIIISQDGTINLIDFGMVGKLSQRNKYAFAGVLVGMAQGDSRAMARNFRRLAIDANINNMKQFEADLNELIEDFAILDLSETNMAELANRLQIIIFDYRLRIPGDIFIILRAMTILEGIGKHIHPHFNTYDFVRPYGLKIFKEKYSAQNVAKEMIYTGSQFVSFINSFPSEFRDLMRTVRKGKLQIEFEQKNYQESMEKVTRSVNRLSVSLIIVSLIVGSSIMMTANLNPGLTTDAGMPYLSIAGFTTACVLAFLLFMGRIFRG